ncbi:MAG: DUF4402 domain-containing protein [candidate division Zixibacteria bacterium]|nr:DUF4402 domain-containing protein [candidate division Zixibacteria bacterium]
MDCCSWQKSEIGLLATVLVTSLLVGPSLLAQAVGTSSASATMVTPISISADTQLKFGNVMQGVPVKVNRTATGSDTSAAVFTISGEDGAGISVQFILPEYLYTATGAHMPIIFSSSDCTIDSLAGTPDTPGGGAWVGVNPYSLPTANIGATNGNTKVYLGGKVIPSVQQGAGSYSADIVISVSYDGS